MREKALTYLRTALGRPDADFREGQWESIQSILARRRLLVVERTGWGKSMVYFLATRLLRDEGAGVSLLISPLLSLMRNQLEAAARIGVRAASINCTNPEDWDRIEQELRNNQIDILLVSPERLANEAFRQGVLAHIAERVGLFVVDEAHCISDWGHDFRPDYRRIVRILQALPGNIPVLATTATANDRVVADVITQLGTGIQLVRGPLVRESLKLQNITMASPAARMAWLAKTIPSIAGSGVVYVLTKADADRITQWLRENGIDARPYYSGVLPGPDDRELLATALPKLGLDITAYSKLKEKDQSNYFRIVLENALIANHVRVLVATVALGMGFDKPDLAFVIHFQRPASVVHYYQQVGRAGRAVDEALGVLLHGEEDDHIADYFIRNAFPPQSHVDAILKELAKAEDGLSAPALEARLNLRHGQIESALKYLSVESPAPVVNIDSRLRLTAAAKSYSVNREYVEAITVIRRREQAQMQAYMEHKGCLMEFLSRALDDPHAGRCGKCAQCIGAPLLNPDYDHGLANRAAIFLKRSHQTLDPRKLWPSGGALPTYGFTGRIGDALRAQEGRALSLWRDAGWGRMVAVGKYDHGRFDDELVGACVEMIREWQPTPAPEWVACIPSLNRPELVPNFAQRLAAALGLPFHPCIQKAKANPPQKEMQNSFQQARNLDGVFVVAPRSVPNGPCFLIDDMTDSGWTFTVATTVLRQAGCSAVFPLALALNSPRMD